MKIRTVVYLAALTGVVSGLIYRDLLASAFDSNPYPGSAQSVARGKLLYDQHCQICHGLGGKGDGPAAKGIDADMDDLSDLPAPPIFPDGVIVYRIANGRNAMPAWRETLSHHQMWDVLNYLRFLGKESVS